MILIFEGFKMFKKNYIITGVIVCKTGLHIGGSNDTVEIGGSDNVIIRDSIDNLPFIPGSSLKGKLRSLTELNDKTFVNKLLSNNNVDNDNPDKAAKIFGESVENKKMNFPTRIIVRDSFPTEDTKEMWEKHVDVINGSELKYENKLNRLNSEASPRNIERVPKGSKFNYEIIYSVYDNDNDNESILTIINSMLLLEDNYLGGSGSRGFGQIKFEKNNIIIRNQDYYKNNVAEECYCSGEDIKKLKENFLKKIGKNEE